jgi:hypothetical protein
MGYALMPKVRRKRTEYEELSYASITNEPQTLC